MPHWLRKHMGEIAWVAQRCAKDYPLTPLQRQTLDEAQQIADRLSIGLRDLGQEAASKAVAMLCAVCTEGLPGVTGLQCAGRGDWREPCNLIARFAV